jgi:ATP-binding cassette subfamily B protein
LSGRARTRAERELLGEQLALQPIELWTLRTPVTAPWRKLFRQGPWLGAVVKLTFLQVLRIGVFLLAWRVIGQAVLTGRLEMGWLMAWALLLLTVAPLHMTGMWLQARFAVALGGLLKQRLLAGALKLDPETVLSMGAGQLLGKTLESSAVENLALAGGFNGLAGLLELAAALSVFAMAGLAGPCATLVLGLVLTAVMCHRYLHRARMWTQTRIGLTNNLVERMVGHRTRLAQENPSKWHDREDQELCDYLTASLVRDRAEALLGLIPQAWMVAGVASLVAAFLNEGVSQSALASGLGGVLLADGAFRRVTSGAWQIADAWVAREQIHDLSTSAEIREPTGSPAHASAPDRISAVEAQEVIYRYAGAVEPVLRRCSLRIARGERVLLEGASGEGKSTFAAVLAGIRVPQSGLLLAGGLDRATIGGEGWRHRVALSPQFHQNHMITGPLTFNLLLGRPEPHTASDRVEAEEICEELGLGPLLKRMPAGITQVVGESGWQMSQGERSRVFLARALLQQADLVILDESFGALDPETRKLAVECAIRRARSLLVIAHR